VTSRVTPSFWRAFHVLSRTDQQASRRAFRQFATDPFHNSLRFKKLAGYEDLWSVRATLSVRAVGRRDGDPIARVWIGSHSKFDNTFG
jgi:hypothetical protein